MVADAAEATACARARARLSIHTPALVTQADVDRTALQPGTLADAPVTGWGVFSDEPTAPASHPTNV